MYAVPPASRTPPAIDRWIPKPAVISTASVITTTFVCQLPGLVSLILIPLTLLSYVCAVFAIFVISAYFFAKKRPRIGSSMLLALLVPIVLWRPINWISDVMHIGLTAGLGSGQLGLPYQSGDGSFAAYDWSVGLVTNPSTFLIHDVTDEIALPTAQHKQSAGNEGSFGESCSGRVDHLLGHYYVCNF